MSEKDFMDDVIKLNDFLDSVFGLVKKFLLAAGVVGAAAVAVVVPIWSLVSQNPVWFLLDVALILVAGALVGAAVTLMSTKGRTKRQIEARDRVISAKDAELKKRPTKEDVDELKDQLRAKDAEIAALKSAKVPTRLDIAKSTLGDEGMRAFRALCAASTYVDGVPSRPLVFSMSDGKLSAIGLSRELLLLMEEADVIRLSEMDERELVGTNARKEPTDIGYGVTACADFVKFDLAGGSSVEVKPVRLTFGTDRYVATGLYGADLGIASFTSLGSELAAEYAALNPPLGIVGYIDDAYSAKLRESRHHFRSLKEDGELRTP